MTEVAAAGVAAATGSCLCGAVRFRIHGRLRDIKVCHCRFCRRASTLVGAYAGCALADLEIAATRKLRWYKSSPLARRGFCAACGSTLFWEPVPATHMAIAAGSLNEPNGLRVAGHIFMDARAEYECVAQPGG